jgi:hypothetical protein
MLRTAILLFGAAIQLVPTVAQAADSDSQVIQTLVSEIHELRQDLLNTAAIIQRVQISMYRLQAEAGLLDKATQRRDQARAMCSEAEAQLKMVETQIEQAEASKRVLQDSVAQQREEQILRQLQGSLSLFREQTRQCQPEQVDAENQFRIEQARMTELQDQFDRLDQALATQARK